MASSMKEFKPLTLIKSPNQIRPTLCSLTSCVASEIICALVCGPKSVLTFQYMCHLIGGQMSSSSRGYCANYFPRHVSSNWGANAI